MKAKRKRGRPPTPERFDGRTPEGLDELRAWVELASLRAELHGGATSDEPTAPGRGERLEVIAKRYNRSPKAVEDWLLRSGRIPLAARKYPGKKK